MQTAPFLDAADLIGSSEGVAVTVFAEPPLLAGGLAGTTTLRCRAIPLAIHRPRIGKEKLTATSALASARRAAHRECDAENEWTTSNSKKTRAKKTTRKKEAEL
jgi:hypothetical protein